MQEEEQPGAVRRELLERLRTMEGAQSAGSLADLAYRRAREALSSALDEARSIRLRALDDARITRERELTALMEQVRALRQTAETQVQEILRAAELEAGRIDEEARRGAGKTIESAREEAARIRAEALALLSGAEQRAREADRLEADLDAVLKRLSTRLDLGEPPKEGWWKRLKDRR